MFLTIIMLRSLAITILLRISIRSSRNNDNLIAKLENYKTFARNMAVNNKTQMVLSHNESIIVSNDQQSPVRSARQPSVKSFSSD